MKLLTKFNRANIIATVIVLLAGALCYYFILHYVLVKQLDSDLNGEMQEVKNFIKVNNSLPDTSVYKEAEIISEPFPSKDKARLTTKEMFDKKENEWITVRQLIFPENISGKYYRITISKSEQETEDLIQFIITGTLSLVLLLFLCLFIINRFVLNKLWHPFNNTLQELKKFNPGSGYTLQLNDNNIAEFKELNNAVMEMSRTVERDYQALKSFTENASHEIQTPLAVINSEADLLMQSENLTELQMNNIQAIQIETVRLSKLNQSLLLLTKIDNRQFIETEPLDISKIIKKLLVHYEELIAAKEIQLKENADKPVIILMNETMAGVLISNLITNAIKHNPGKGFIEIVLSENKLIIRNTGPVLTAQPHEMFERFKKENLSSESLGLGLSIVKKICDLYHFRIEYGYARQIHILTVQFK